MEALRFLRGKVVPLDVSDVDTDQIVPKQFLKRIERTGFGNFLFYNWRFDRDGNPISEFPLNNDLYRGASILLARRNFGTGSSREHAVWALQDFGFKIIISPKFGEIFYNNALKNGLLPIVLPEHIVNYMFEKVYELEKLNKNYFLDVDVEKQIIKDDFGFSTSFEIDEFRKYCLIEGLDDIALTLKYEEKIKEYEEKRERLYYWRSWKNLLEMRGKDKK